MRITAMIVLALAIGTAGTVLGSVPVLAQTTPALEVCASSDPVPSGCGTSFPQRMKESLYLVMSGLPVGNRAKVVIADADGATMLSNMVPVTADPLVMKFTTFGLVPHHFGMGPWPFGTYTVTVQGTDGTQLTQASFTLTAP